MDKQLQALQHNLEAADLPVWDQFRGVTKLIVHGMGDSCGLNEEAAQ